LKTPYLPADTIAEFSSRGPRALDAFQKPDVAAPGVSICAARMGTGNEGTAISGTSMASPHVAGVAALVRQEHPDWSPQQVKAAIMNTAVDLQSRSAEVPRQGAGWVDAYRAVTTNALALGDRDRISISWGITQFSEDFYQDTKTIILHDLSGESGTYDVSVVWGEKGFLVHAPALLRRVQPVPGHGPGRQPGPDRLQLERGGSLRVRRRRRMGGDPVQANTTSTSPAHPTGGRSATTPDRTTRLPASV
jgi:subtilisin family serine protease